MADEAKEAFEKIYELAAPRRVGGCRQDFCALTKPLLTK